MQPVGIGEEGMIYVSGPSVFSGYLDATLADPFILIHGDKFYRTGDMGKRDADGFLFIT